MAQSITKTTALHPADRDQVVQAFEQPIADPVFGQTMCTGIMVNGNLGDGKSMHEREGWKEPMHALE